MCLQSTKKIVKGARVRKGWNCINLKQSGIPYRFSLSLSSWIALSILTKLSFVLPIYNWSQQFGHTYKLQIQMSIPILKKCRPWGYSPNFGRPEADQIQNHLITNIYRKFKHFFSFFQGCMESNDLSYQDVNSTWNQSWGKIEQSYKKN